MRFTPSSEFTSLALGSGKVITHKFEMRKPAALNESLTGGTAWTDVTYRIKKELPEANSKIEYQLGQFTSDSITLEGLGIEYFMTNWFNGGLNALVELKWTATIEGAADVINVFTGWCEIVGNPYTELEDKVTFTVKSADDMMGGIPAELITTQYIEDSVETDGTGTNGIILHNIKNLYVTDANISTKVLQVGIHKITYEFNNYRYAKLDDGEYVQLNVGFTTLINKDNTQHVKVYVRNTGDLPAISDPIEDIIIVRTYGDTLPYQWYHNVSIKSLFNRIYAVAGLDTVSYDTMEMDTALGDDKVSFIGSPPNDGAVQGYKWAVTSDGTYLYIGIGNKLYRYDYTTDTYVLKATIATNYIIYRLIYNARNGHIIIISCQLPSFSNYIYRYVISSSTLSSAVDIGVQDIPTIGLCLIDYNYTGILYKYGIIYVDRTNSPYNEYLKFINCDDLSITTIFSDVNIGKEITDGFIYLRNNNEIRFITTASPDYFVHKISVDGSGNWVNDGQQYQIDTLYYAAAYDSKLDRIYYHYLSVIESSIRYHPYNSGTSTIVYTFESLELVDEFYFADDGTLSPGTFFSTSFLNRNFYKISNTTLTLIHSDIHTRYNSLVYGMSKLWGIDQAGRLFQYSNKISFYVKDAVFEGRLVRDVLNTILQAFNLIQKISTTKKAFIYRRGNASGVPQTTGNTLSVTVNEASDIEVEKFASGIFDMVEVSNEKITYNYDGTNWNTGLMDINTRRLTLTNALIPDEIVQDICYYVYQFFKTNRDLYRIPLDMITLWQYEPFDNLSITFTTTKIQKTASGPLYGVTLIPKGSMIVEGLL